MSKTQGLSFPWSAFQQSTDRLLTLFFVVVVVLKKQDTLVLKGRLLSF